MNCSQAVEDKLTTRSCTDCDEDPGVKTAWSMAKKEVFSIAANSAFTAFFTTAIGLQLIDGHPLMAVGFALLGIGRALQGLVAYKRLSSKLSKLPGPGP